METRRERSILRTALTVNGATCAATGLAFLGGGHRLGPLFGLAAPVLWVLGAGLLAIALHLARVVRRPSIGRAQALYFLVSDVAWVVASVVVLLAWPGLLSGLGRLVFAVMADFVALLAVLELVGYRRLAAAARRMSATAG